MGTMNDDDLRKRNETAPVTMAVPQWMLAQIDDAAAKCGEPRERVLWGLLILGLAHSVSGDGLDLGAALSFADAKDRSEKEQRKMMFGETNG